MSFSLIKAISKPKDNVLIPNLKFMVPYRTTFLPPEKLASTCIFSQGDFQQLQPRN